MIFSSGLFYYTSHQKEGKENEVKEEVRVTSEGNDIIAEVVVDGKKSDKEMIALMQSYAKKLEQEHEGKKIHLVAIRNGKRVADMVVNESDGHDDKGGKSEKANEQEKLNEQVGEKGMNITEAKKVEFLEGTYAYKIEGKLPKESKATAVVLKIGTQTFEQTVGENGEFQIMKLLAEEVTEAIVETKGDDQVLSQKITF